MCSASIFRLAFCFRSSVFGSKSTATGSGADTTAFGGVPASTLTSALAAGFFGTTPAVGGDASGFFLMDGASGAFSGAGGAAPTTSLGTPLSGGAGTGGALIATEGGGAAGTAWAAEFCRFRNATQPPAATTNIATIAAPSTNRLLRLLWGATVLS